MAHPKPEVSAFVHALPKVELHVHIEGTLTPALRWRLAQENSIKLPYASEKELEASYKVTYNHRKKDRGDNGQPTFFDAYYGGMQVLRKESDFFALGLDYFRRAHAMNVRYAEPFFDIQAHTRRGVSVNDVMRGFQRASETAARELGVHSSWIMCFLRDMSPASAMEHYELALPYRHIFTAIGLDSDEYERPASLFEEVFARARRDGLKLTSHCDVYKKDTHEHILGVASQLGGYGADRIDHGLNAADRPELMQLIKDRGIGMTLCPHAYHRHEPTDMVFPLIRRLYDFGIPITINSDDPTYMHDHWVVENLELARELCPFDTQELVQLERNAVDISWASPQVKEMILQELNRVSAAL